MAASTRFALGVHILALLASNRDQAVTSQTIAASANTNPAFVRRLLAQLNKAGLTKSQPGKGGGSQLAKGPKKITLLDIFEAVDAGRIVAAPKSYPENGCYVAANLAPVFRDLTSDAEVAFFSSLSDISLKQVVKSLRTAADCS